jgi:hypothetical protein
LEEYLMELETRDLEDQLWKDIRPIPMIPETRAFCRYTTDEMLKKEIIIIQKFSTFPHIEQLLKAEAKKRGIL